MANVPNNSLPQRGLFSPNIRIGRDGSSTSPSPPGKIAIQTLLAPMAQIDSPTAGPDSPVAEGPGVVTEGTVTPSISSPTLLGAIGSRIVGALTGRGPLGSASPSSVPVASRRRSIDEVEDTAVKLNNQPKGLPRAADLRAREAASNSPTFTDCSVSSSNGLGTSSVPAKSSTRPKQVLTPAQKAIKPTEAKPSPPSRQQRVTKLDVAGAAPGSKSVAAKPDSVDTSNILSKFEIDKIVGYRHDADDPTLLDVRVSWKSDDPAGDFTWEPESSVQEDAPDVLFRYWRTFKGGRSSVLKDPDMWHILRIEKHRIIRDTNEVELHVAWIGSTQRSWEPEESVAEYAKEHL
ncbi:hypothetical protein B0I35DRAFT_197362, partial [Stachybotrys elegans]